MNEGNRRKRIMNLVKGLIYPKPIMERRLKSESNNCNLKKTKWKILPNNLVMFEGFKK